MSTITLHDLEENPAAVLDRVAAGEHLVVVREGVAVAELRPMPAKRTTPRPFGLAKGQFVVPDDFNAPLPEEILRDFEGR
jgi:antitoxin (DNA-binding transcriptional repressor) of toxin-antitoxin stability system